MKALLLLAFACLSPLAWGQTAALPGSAPPSDLPEDTVVAVFDDGAKLTMAQFNAIVGALPPDNRQLVMRNRETFLHQYGVMRKLAQMAVQNKLDQSSPLKEMVEYNRMMLLTQAQLSEQMNRVTVEPGSVEKYYEANKDRFKTIKVKAIYVSFGEEKTAGKKSLTEAQAKTKAEKLLAEIRAGADFVKLVKEHSDDQTSREKDGDFVTLRQNDNIPDAIRNAVFALQQGEVSEPVKQPNGFYLLRAEEIKFRPLTEVQDEVFTQVRQQQYANWMRDLDAGTKVEYPVPAFLGIGKTPATAPPAK